MIIDFHTHTFPPKIAASTLEKLSAMSHTLPFTDGTPEGLRASMGEAGVDLSVVLPVATAPRQVEHINDSSAAISENFREAGLPYTGSLKVLRTIMAYDYLWNQVRVKGGAYGCMNSYTRNGDTYLVSYRDPNLEKTLQVYEDSVDFIKNFQASERDMTRFIIGTISDLDVPLTPHAQGARSMGAYLSHLTFEDVQRERDQVLSADSEAIRELAAYLQAVLAQKHLCVIGNEEKLNAQKELFGEVKNLFH